MAPRLNRRQPPTVRNDGSFPASAGRVEKRIILDGKPASEALVTLTLLEGH
jgi:hypothetical protein